MLLRLAILLFLSSPVAAAPGAEAAEDMRCAAILSRVGDALEDAGQGATLPTLRGMQAALVNLAATREPPPATGLMGELARTPPVSLPASAALLARVEACAARLSADGTGS